MRSTHRHPRVSPDSDLWVISHFEILGPIKIRLAMVCFHPSDCLLWLNKHFAVRRRTRKRRWTQEVTWFWRDQGGTSANYVDHILTKIAADNYISGQMGEQSIVLSTEQRWPPPDKTMTSNPIRTSAHRWHSCHGPISHLSTSRPLSSAAHQPNSALINFLGRRQIDTDCVDIWNWSKR